jgi:putative inorganic carbon (hco3(-)) transporter
MRIEPAPLTTTGAVIRGMSARAPKRVARSTSAYNIWLAIFLAVLVGKAGEWVPGITGFPLVKIAFIITALSAYWARKKFAPVRVTSLRIARPAIAFLILSIVSIFFSIYKSFTLISIQTSLIYLVSLTLLIKITQTQREVERLLIALAIAGVSLSVGLLLTYHGGRAHINANFDPNDIAYELDTLLPLVLALRGGRSALARLLIHLAALAMIVAILLTGSRGGALGLGVVLIGITAFPLDFTKSGELRRFAPTGMLVRWGLVMVMGIAIWGHLPVDSQERLETLLDLEHDYNADPNLNASRTVLWRRDILLGLERPIGYGMGSASAVDGLHGGQYRTAHNSFVQAFVELGALGLWLYAFTYYVTWRELGRLSVSAQGGSKERARTALYARAFRLSLAGNLAAGFFLSQAYSASLWMTVAICAAFVRIASQSSAAPSSAPASLAT